MRGLKRIVVNSVVVYCCLALLTISAGYAQGITLKEWAVPNFGVFKVPQDLNLASIMDLLKSLETEHQSKVPQDKLEALGKDRKDFLNQIDFGIYQLTLEEGAAFYQSGVVLVKEKQPSSYTRQFLDGSTNITQKISIIKFHDMMVRELDKLIADLEKIANKESKVTLSIKMLERPPLQFTEVGGKLAAATSLRMLLKYGDFMYPFYGKIYFFTVDGCLAAMLMVTSDSERLYWEPKLDTVIKTLESKQP